MLKVEQVSCYYKNVRAVHQVSLEIKAGHTVALIGSNGSGKSTILNTISGLIRPREGKVLIEGQEIQGLEPHKIVKLGIVQVPEGRRIFSNLTVQENLEVGAFNQKGKQKVNSLLERVYQLFPRLEEKRQNFGGEMSGGEQQMLAIGRALMAEPKVLLLDEPSLGLAPLMVNLVFRSLQSIKQDGISILLVEQNSKMALKYSDYSYVLENGEVTLEGFSMDLARKTEVQKAYLGA